MKVHIARNGANFGAESGNFVSEHARCGNLDRIVPVVVVVAKCVGKVEDRHLRDCGRVFGHVEMCRFHAALCHRVRYEEEVELAIYHLRLLDEACINVGSLWWVVNVVLTVRATRLLEEALAHTLVYDDQSDLGQRLRWR